MTSNEPLTDYLIPMFSIPILHLKVRDWESKRDQLLRIYGYIESNRKEQTQQDVETDYHYNFKTPDTCYSSEISTILNEEISIATHELLVADLNINETDENNSKPFFMMENSWFERAAKYSSHQVHNHGPYGYSSVCYLQYSNEKHTPTHFLNPFITSNPAEQYFVPDGVGEGSILFWPSPILHYTESNKSDVDRIILSFNLSIQDECGLLN